MGELSEHVTKSAKCNTAANLKYLGCISKGVLYQENGLLTQVLAS